MEAPSRLGDAVYGFEDLAHVRLAGFVVPLVPRWHVAVDRLTLDEVTLKVCGDVVDAAYLATALGGVGEQGPCRAIA